MADRPLPGSARWRAHLPTGHRAVPGMMSLLLIGLSLVASPGAAEQYWVYTVRPGDTIWDLTRKHCTSVLHWRRIQTLNAIERDRVIPPGTRLRFPLSLLKHQPAAARVAQLEGSARLLRAGTQTAQPLQANTELRSGDRIITGPDTTLTLRFADASRLLVLGDSEVVMDSLSAWGSTGMVDTRIRLKGGRVDTRVEPGRGPGSRYQIITPAAVAAVRGTDFRIAATGPSVMRSEVIGGTVAVSGSGGSTAVPAGFGLVAEAGKPPPAPRELLPPPDLTGIASLQRELPVRFDWAPLAGVRGYRFQIARDTTFQTLLADRTVTQPQAHEQDLADGHYAIRVRGIDATGLEGIDAVSTFEVDARPFVPGERVPADGSVTQSATPELDWADSDTATGYRVQIASDTAFTAPVVDLTVDGRGYRPDTPLSPGDYYWRVAAIGPHGDQGPFSTAQQLTYRRPPGVPQPEPVIVERQRVRFAWPAVDGASRYQLQLAEAPDFTTITADHTTSDPQFTLPRPASQVYYFRVRAFDAPGTAGPFSATQRLYVPPLHPWWPLLLAVPLLLVL